MDDLKRLVLSAQARDSAAFGELVVRFQDMAFALAYAKVGSLHPAEDIAQEAFIEAYLHIDRLESPHAFVSWFRTIVNRQINRHARGKRLLFCSLDAVANAPQEEPLPEDHAQVREMQETIHTAIQALPENERQAIMLFYIGGYSQKEIAETLDVRLSTVKSRLYEARQRLRERMSQMVEETLQSQRPSNDSKFTEKVMALVQAIETGKTDMATKLFEKDERLLTAPGQLPYNRDSLPPLFLAIQKGNLDLIEYLLDKGVDINGKSTQGWTPHFYALNWRHPVDIAAHLRDRGAIPDIYSITWMGKLDQLKALIEEAPALAQTKGPEGTTLLHFAPTVEMVQYLLDQGADINARNDNGKPPAGYRFVQEVNDFLLAQGAVVDDIMLACEVGALEQVKALLAKDPQLFYANSENGDGSYPLLRAALNGHTDVVRYMLTIDDNVNYNCGSWGFAPIIAAALGGNLETVQFLIQHGADVNIRLGRADETALHWAIETALHWAWAADSQQDQSLAIAKCLLEHGAEVDAKTKHGATPLHWAVKGNRLDVIQLLLGYGADPHITSDEMEQSPLMRAKRLGRDDVVKILTD